jgi:hypothetical protein
LNARKEGPIQMMMQIDNRKWMPCVGLTAALYLGAAVPSWATLHGRDLDGNNATIEAVYDDVTDLTWAANANLAQSEDFGVTGIASNGRMPWDTAVEWIGAMNTAGWGGFSDWRIPVTALDDGTCSPGVPSTSTGACRGSELGHLFNVSFGADGNTNIWLSITPADLALFTNFPSGPVGYTSSEYPPNTDANWTINDTGIQSIAPKTSSYRVWPVRSGDVSNASQVPGSSPGWLAVLGVMLVACVLWARRRRLGVRTMAG